MEAKVSCERNKTPQITIIIDLWHHNDTGRGGLGRTMRVIMTEPLVNWADARQL